MSLYEVAKSHSIDLGKPNGTLPTMAIVYNAIANAVRPVVEEGHGGKDLIQRLGGTPQGLCFLEYLNGIDSQKFVSEALSEGHHSALQGGARIGMIDQQLRSGIDYIELCYQAGENMDVQPKILEELNQTRIELEARLEKLKKL